VEQLIAEARNTAQASTLESSHRYAHTITGTQVHVVLALAVATGVGSDGRERHNVTCIKLSG
jgi:hypothetical protein